MIDKDNHKVMEVAIAACTFCGSLCIARYLVCAVLFNPIHLKWNHNSQSSHYTILEPYVILHVQ